MAAAALANFQHPTSPYPLAALPLKPDLLGMLHGYHARQMRPSVIVAAVWDWLRARGGRPEGVLNRLRLPGEGADPHVLNFGPALNGSFLRCLYRAHVVVPYRVEGASGSCVSTSTIPVIRGTGVGTSRFAAAGSATAASLRGAGGASRSCRFLR
jgi:hypothetical protein